MEQTVKNAEHSQSRVPGTPEEITANWLETVLNIEINPKSLSITGNANAGVGFLSNLVRIGFEEVLHEGHTKEHHLVAKLLPLTVPERQRVIAEKMDKTELNFYLKLIPQILNEMPTLESYFCPFIYGHVQEEDLENGIAYSSVLILKDLSKDGYILKPFTKEELSNQEIHATLEFLSGFHASSVLLEIKKKKRLTDIYGIFPEWCYPTNSKNPRLRIHEFIKSGFSLAKDVITHYTTNINPSEKESGNEIIANLIEPFISHSQELFNGIVRAGYQYPSLIHQDLWQNNILVSSAPPTTIKAIDWQMIGYSDSVYDVAIFLITSLSSKLEIHLLEKYAKLYFKRLEEILSDKEKEGVDFSGVKRRTWTEFWLALTTYGLTFVFLVYIIGCNTAIAFPDNFSKILQAFHFFHCHIHLEKFLSEIIRCRK